MSDWVKISEWKEHGRVTHEILKKWALTEVFLIWIYKEKDKTK